MNDDVPAKRFWEALGAWLDGGPPPVWYADGALEVSQPVLRGGLGPLFYAWAAPDPTGDLRAVYLQNLARYERWLPMGVVLCGELERAGIPCIPMRGPFAGRRYYRDPSTRCFTDLDLLVPRASLDRAVQVARGAGYEFRQPLLSPRFYRSVHLHYPLRHAQSGVLCDLHWALDHPFRRCGIPCEELFTASTMVQFEDVRWRCMAPEHAILVACDHARKELESGPGATTDLLESAWVNRQLFSLLDIALMSSAGCDADRLNGIARRWDMETDAVRVIGAAQRLRQGLGPAGHGVLPAAESPAWMERVGGFRRRRMHDAWSYVMGSGRASDGGRYPWHRRLALAGRSAWHLIAAGTVAAGCLLRYRLRTARGGTPR